ncbi:hypothetical protein CDL15_Pgr005571 [Punica granatum]|nr:hypothetical protein CDL15_Pgr005571 [Punica granatum]
MLLLSFKSAAAPGLSRRLSSWNASVSHCTWYGVTCDGSSDRVVALNLKGSSCSAESDGGLSGTLPASVGDLSELQALSLPCNFFTGEIPGSIERLQSLQVLELQGNNFSGEIPNQISHIHTLRLLNLSGNLFSGSIPNELIGHGRLSSVDLSNNQLSGGITIHRTSSCRFLRHLKLSNNFLIGNIPPEIGKCINLRTLLLDGNILEGKIPPQIGQIVELRVLDVSRNSFTDRIPKELSYCRKLSVLILTNLMDYSSSSSGDSSMESLRGEFNAFVGGIPYEVFQLPSLQMLWAPRANLEGRLPTYWTDSCPLRALNMGQNYITGVVPQSLGMCRNLTFLDLSSNNLVGYLPSQLPVPCMVYFNVSRNNITGGLSRFRECICVSRIISYGKYANILTVEDVERSYSNIPFSSDKFAIAHDLSWNSFIGPLPLFVIGDRYVATKDRFSYRLLLNNNRFGGPFPVSLVSNCSSLRSLSVNLSANEILMANDSVLLLDCMKVTEFEAAQNQIGGSISPAIGDLTMLQLLDLRGNRLSGVLPDELGKLKDLKWLLLGGNNFTGEIPSELGQLNSIVCLDLSQNALMGAIPASLTNASSLETLFLDHNWLSGEIPPSFSVLPNLTKLDLSFNNLSGHIPRLQHENDCEAFKGNLYLHSCPDLSAPPGGLPVPLEVHRMHGWKRPRPLIIALVTSACVILLTFLVIVLVLVIAKRKFRQGTSLRKRVIITFPNAPPELNYESVVGATDNFSIRNLIGTGGFGSTYKAELLPGFLVAVKRLSVGRFQGIQQFDAEIRTLGRIRHKNLVTLLGYFMGETEMFLVYNYLSGGNLETFIHERSGKNLEWLVIHKIALDVAQALAYLHYSCSPRIVHRDIKPSNILLDKELHAYLSDFGLARLLEVSETHATTDVLGTFGYVAPEYATTCRVSDKADVYSFGVVLLELMSGKKSIDPSFSDYRNGFNIVGWAKLLLREGRAQEFFSLELWEGGPSGNLLGLLRLASYCTSELLSIRPSMKQVVEKLKQLGS